MLKGRKGLGTSCNIDRSDWVEERGGDLVFLGEPCSYDDFNPDLYIDSIDNELSLTAGFRDGGGFDIATINSITGEKNSFREVREEINSSMYTEGHGTVSLYLKRKLLRGQSVYYSIGYKAAKLLSLIYRFHVKNAVPMYLSGGSVILEFLRCDTEEEIKSLLLATFRGRYQELLYLKDDIKEYINFKRNADPKQRSQFNFSVYESLEWIKEIFKLIEEEPVLEGDTSTDIIHMIELSDLGFFDFALQAESKDADGNTIIFRDSQVNIEKNLYQWFTCLTEDKIKSGTVRLSLIHRDGSGSVVGDFTLVGLDLLLGLEHVNFNLFENRGRINPSKLLPFFKAKSEEDFNELCRQFLPFDSLPEYNILKSDGIQTDLAMEKKNLKEWERVDLPLDKVDLYRIKKFFSLVNPEFLNSWEQVYVNGTIEDCGTLKTLAIRYMSEFGYKDSSGNYMPYPGVSLKSDFSDEVSDCKTSNFEEEV